MNGPADHHDDEIRIRRLRPDDDPRLSHEPAAGSLLSGPKKPPRNVGSYGIPDVKTWYFFAVELQTAIAAGVPFVRAISLVGEGTQYRSVRRATDRLLIMIREKSADRAIVTIEGIPAIIRNLVAVGLRGGDLPGLLGHVINHYRTRMEIRSMILRAIFYPGALVILGLLVMMLRDLVIATMQGTALIDALVMVVLLYVVPAIFAAVAAIVLAWVMMLPGIRPTFDRIVLTAPYIGKIIDRYSQAVFFRVLAVLLEAGMPVTDAWDTALESLPNSYVGRKLEAGMRFLQDGDSIHEALKQSRAIDPEGLGLAAVGEQAGTTPDLLKKFAGYAEMELIPKVKLLTVLFGFFALGMVTVGFFVNPQALFVLIFLVMFVRRII